MNAISTDMTNSFVPDREDTRAVIMDPRARSIGFSWFQENNGKLWWVLSVGG